MGSKGNSPIEEDMEIPIGNSVGDNKSNIISDIANALEVILSEEHFDQKTIISRENEIGLIGIDVLQAYMLDTFGKSYPSLEALKISKQEHAVSVDGQGRAQITEIFKSLQPNIITSDTASTSLRSRLMGR